MPFVTHNIANCNTVILLVRHYITKRRYLGIRIFFIQTFMTKWT